MSVIDPRRAPRDADTDESAPDVDHDQAAWIARWRRGAADIARVRVLARTHAGDQEWDEVDALLHRLGIAWGRDLGPPSALR